jgi:hypothetical protein
MSFISIVKCITCGVPSSNFKKLGFVFLPFPGRNCTAIWFEAVVN